MRWPWQRSETRDSVYTDTLVQLLVQQASGNTLASPSGLAALETAAGLYGRAFMAAEVDAAPAVAGALSPEALSSIARDMIRNGESLFAVSADEGGIMLRRAWDWDVSGGADPNSWLYRYQLPGPSRPVTVTALGTALLHFRYATDPARPWRGRSPVEFAAITSGLAANAEQRLREEAGGPVGHILPVPQGPSDPDSDDDPFAGLSADLSKAKGGTILTETTSAGFGEGRGSAPNQDWVAKRFGAAPPAALVELRNASASAVLDACGIPSALTASGGDGAGRREAWRQFLWGSVAPLARVIETEITAKLGTPVRLRFDELRASDLAGRARAFQSMVGGGMEIEKAAALAGLMEE